MQLLGGIEAGGTKMVCGIGTKNGEVIERAEFSTRRPEETLEDLIGFFRGKEIAALGIGSFGPVDVREDSPTYGSITSTPKPGWANYPLLSTLQEALSVPTGFDTDVNAAALGETVWGAAQGLGNCVYFTIGTGVGAGVVVNGELVHGLVHPELGHIRIARHESDHFKGNCPYHSDCLEGLAAGPAIEKRWGLPGKELAERTEVWELEAYYIAQAVVNSILTLSPERVILGGGVMKQRQLFPLVRRNVQELLNGYVVHPQLQEHIEDYIVPPGLGDNAGLCGGLALAARELEKRA